jgi:hypothetical protein
MRISFALLLLATWVVAGCAHKQEAMFKPVAGETPAETSVAPAPTPAPAPAVKPAAKPEVKPAASTPASLEVTPVHVMAGKVARYNEAGRFVVLEFPVGQMPAVGQRLSVYRNGLKVGELKVTGPQRDDHIVADVTNGEAQAGDEARDK